MTQIIAIDTPTLGDRSYLVHDGRVAFVVDPQWVHCAVGYRASIAASILAAAGRRIVAIDDGYDNAAPAGLRLVTGAAV